MIREARCIHLVYAWWMRYSRCGNPWNAALLQKRGAAEKALNRLAGCIDRGLDCVAEELPVIRGHVEVVRSIAATLDPTQGDCDSRRDHFSELHRTCQASADLARQQMAKDLLSFEPVCFQVAISQDCLRIISIWSDGFANPKATKVASTGIAMRVCESCWKARNDSRSGLPPASARNAHGH